MLQNGKPGVSWFHLTDTSHYIVHTTSSTSWPTERIAVRTLIKPIAIEPDGKHSSEHVVWWLVFMLARLLVYGFTFLLTWTEGYCYPLLGPALFSSEKAMAANLRGHCIYMHSCSSAGRHIATGRVMCECSCNSPPPHVLSVIYCIDYTAKKQNVGMLLGLKTLPVLSKINRFGSVKWSDQYWLPDDSSSLRVVKQEWRKEMQTEKGA